MNSFIFVATTLVLLHLNQPHLTFGREVPQADPPLTWPCGRGNSCPWPWPRPPVRPSPVPPPPAKPSPLPVPSTPEEPNPTPSDPVDPTPVPVPSAPEEPKPVPSPPVDPKPVPSPPVDPKPVPSPPVKPSNNGTCKMNYGSCVTVFKGLMKWEERNVTAGTECCGLFGGLIGYQSAWCLCSSFKGEFFGFKFEIPIAIDIALNTCNKKLPKEFKCP